MRALSLSVLGLGSVAMVAAAGFASPASAGRQPVESSRAHVTGAPASGDSVDACYVQGLANGSGLVSQNFESKYDDFDSRAADDFRLKSTCTVKLVTVKGDYFNGSGPADSVNVILYRNSGGVPGTILKQFADRPYSDPSGTGNFSIPLPATVLQPGLYWVSVRANMDYDPAGEWEWLTNYSLHNNVPVWRNPGDGFGTGCIDYGSVFDCGFDDEDGGQSFAFTIG